MTTIGGPGGIGGPSGPKGPHGSDAIDEAADAGEVTPEAAVEHARGGAATSELDRLAAEVAAGRLTRHEAIDRLVEATAGPGLDASARAELREVLSDLVANDPYLGALIGRI